MQKNKLIAITLFILLFLIVAKNEQVEVKYSQFFADKKIVLTEKRSVLGYFALPLKKGFIKYEL